MARHPLEFRRLMAEEGVEFTPKEATDLVARINDLAEAVRGVDFKWLRDLDVSRPGQVWLAWKRVRALGLTDLGIGEFLAIRDIILTVDDRINNGE